MEQVNRIGNGWDSRIASLRIGYGERQGWDTEIYTESRMKRGGKTEGGLERGGQRERERVCVCFYTLLCN